MIRKIEHHIGRLRQKPEHVRKQIAFFTSLAVTLVIFVGWVASYGISSSPAMNTVADTKTPLASLTASVGDLYDSIKGIFSGSNKAEYVAPIELIPGKR